MACDTRPIRTGQTLDQRKSEVRQAIDRLQAALVSGRAKAIIDRASGAIAFTGWDDRAQVSDACAYRLTMAFGSATAKAAIARAEALAGRTVNRQALAAGVHAHAGHDGALHWHHGH